MIGLFLFNNYLNYTKEKKEEKKVKKINENNEKLTIENETLSQTIQSLPEDNLPFIFEELKLDDYCI